MEVIVYKEKEITMFQVWLYDLLGFNMDEMSDETVEYHSQFFTVRFLLGRYAD